MQCLRQLPTGGGVFNLKNLPYPDTAPDSLDFYCEFIRQQLVALTGIDALEDWGIELGDPPSPDLGSP